MKLRIKGNSIRLRLLRSEVERFAADGRVSDEVRFGANALRYSLLASTETETIIARFVDAEITVVIPESKAMDWAKGNDIGLEVEQPIGDGELLTILIEKDFACLNRPDDPDRADAYPNLQESC